MHQLFFNDSYHWSNYSRSVSRHTPIDVSKEKNDKLSDCNIKNSNQYMYIYDYGLCRS